MSIPKLHLTLGVVIATRNRPDPLRACLQSLDNQTVLPDELIVVDSSPGSGTRQMLDELRESRRYRCEYQHTNFASAAEQRNLGAESVKSDIILFLDDDVVLEPDFVSEILAVFNEDVTQRLGGVSGTIVNQVYSDPKGLNRLLLGLCLGRFKGSFAGKVLGPAVNFLPADGAVPVQEVEWLPSTCTSYRRDVFLAHRFESTFAGYSFAEDLHLSTRIAREYRLLNTTRARVFHSDLGKDTHRDWVALGESQVRNRHLIMTAILGKRGWSDHLRLFGFEIVYTSLALVSADIGPVSRARLGNMMLGKLKGFRQIWSAGSLPLMKP